MDFPPSDHKKEKKINKTQQQNKYKQFMSVGICAILLHLSSCGKTGHILDGWFSCVTLLC